MTEKAFPRPEFDRDADFVVNRDLMLSGEIIPPGTPFDKALVDLRRLRQLYDQRYLRFAESKPKPPEQRPKLQPKPGRFAMES